MIRVLNVISCWSFCFPHDNKMAAVPCFTHICILYCLEWERESVNFPELPEKKLRVFLNIIRSSLNILVSLTWVTCFSPSTSLEWRDLQQVFMSTQRCPLHYWDQETVLCVTRVCTPCSVRTRWVLRRWWIYRLSSWLQNNMGQISDGIT